MVGRWGPELHKAGARPPRAGVVSKTAPKPDLLLKELRRAFYAAGVGDMAEFGECGGAAMVVAPELSWKQWCNSTLLPLVGGKLTCTVKITQRFSMYVRQKARAGERG